MRETATNIATLSLPKAFPSSQRKYLTGSRSDLLVPHREITLSPTHHSRGTDEDPPLPVCDTPGPSAIPIALSKLRKACRRSAATGQGPRNPKALRELRDRLPDVPLIVDAGLGLPSHACQVVRMATAFANATKAGRLGYLAGPMPVQDLAVASTPEIDKPFWGDASQFVAKGTA
jgi:hypothetical protein